MCPERPEEVIGALVQPLQRALVVEPRAFELHRQLLVAAVAQAGRVALVGPPPHLLHETPEALRDAGGLELVAEHGGKRERHRCTLVEQLEQRQIGAGHGLPQPLLAEGPGAEALHVGHVGVQDDRQRALLTGAGAHARHTARKSSARSRSASPAARSTKSRALIAGVKRP